MTDQYEVIADPGLSNVDIAPVPQAQRNWKAISFFSLWVGMAVNIPAYMIAASLVEGGMSWQHRRWQIPWSCGP